MNKQRYRHTVSTEFDAMDDIQARAIADLLNVNVSLDQGEHVLGDTLKVKPNVSCKLQRIYVNKPPEKVDPGNS